MIVPHSAPLLLLQCFLLISEFFYLVSSLFQPEVVGLRLYTGPAYLKLNGLLR
jgi:hypothetical protein